MYALKPVLLQDLLCLQTQRWLYLRLGLLILKGSGQQLRRRLTSQTVEGNVDLDSIRQRNDIQLRAQAR